MAMTTTTTFEQKIQRWVSLDNQIKSYAEKINELREAKTRVNEEILEHVEKNNLDKATVQITGGRLRFVKSRVANPLSFKYIEKTLATIISNPTQVNQIVDVLKENRDIKTVTEIKRYSAI